MIAGIRGAGEDGYTKPYSLANFVGIGRVPPDMGVGFLNVSIIRLRSLLLAAALSFECDLVLKKNEGQAVLSINSQNPQMRLISKAVEVLRDGGVIIYPTDTVYGLGCSLSNKRGIEKIYEIKRRNKKRPLSFVCSDLKHISQYAMVSDYAYKTMKRFLPGPYTFILEASRLVPKIILPKRPTTGIRVPDNQICLALIRELGQPIISTSVQTEDGEDLGNPSLIDEYFGRIVDLVIDGGTIVPEPSSVVSLVNDTIELIRIGKGDVSAFQ